MSEPRPLCIVDFRRLEARPALAAVLAERGWPVITADDPVAELAVGDRPPSLPTLARRCVDKLAGDGDHPGVVVGVCAAARLGLLVAELLRRRGVDTRCVLVDPNWAGHAELTVSFDAILSSLGGSPAAARAALASAGDTGPEVERMTAILERRLRTALSEKGQAAIADAVVPMMVGRYRGWLGFLQVAGTATPALVPPTWAVVPPGRTRPQWWEGVWRTTVVEDLDDKLRRAHPEAIDAVTATIEEALTAGLSST